MFSTAKKYIMGVLGLILALGVCFTAVSIYKKADTATDNGMDQYDILLSQYGDSMYARYDGGSASGDEILSLLENMRAEDGVSITVINGSSTSTVYSYTTLNASGSTQLKDAKTRSKTTTFINPNANFTSSVTKDANGVISGITFTQK